MKKKNVCFAVAMMMLSAGCSNVMEDTSMCSTSKVVKRAAIAGSDDPWGELLEYDQIDAAAYVEEHADIFGNVLVFDSFGEVDELLTRMREMNYEDLRNFYSELQIERGFQNKVIESNIFYDSIYVEVAKEYGYNLLAEDAEIEDDEFYEQLDNEFLIEENEFLLEKVFRDEESGLTSQIIEPISNIDQSALVNSEGIVVIDKTVHYAFDGTWISLPITKYHYIAETQFTSVEGLQMALNAGTLGGLTPTEVNIHNPQNVSTQKERTQKHHIGYNSDLTRIMVVDIDAYEFSKITPQNTVVGSFTVTNYKRTRRNHLWRMWSHLEGKLDAKINFVIECCGFHEIHMGRNFSENPEYIKGSQTFYTPYVHPSSSYCPFAEDVYPYDISINFCNWQGCCIRY